MRSRLPAVALVLLLAGCTDAGPADEGADDSDGGPPALIEAPVWSVGDWWTYETGEMGLVTWVVTEDAGDAWVLDVDDADMAFWHAAFGQVSTVGAVGKRHLDGSQESGPVHFLDFPLHDNKTWSLTWDGVDFQATARLEGQRAHVTAKAADGSVRTYTYDASVRWFRSIEARDPNGTVEFASKYQNGGSGYGGEVVRWTVHDVHAYHMGMGEHLFEQFQVPEEATDVWYNVEAYCDPAGTEGDQGGYTVDIGSEESNYENGYQVHNICPAPVSDTGTMEADPGNWGVIGASVGGRVDVVLIPRTEAWFGVE